MITKTLHLTEFDKIDLQVGANVTIQQGDSQEVIITGQNNILEDLQTSVKNNQVKFSSQVHCLKNTKLDMMITVPNIDRVIIKGSGDVIVENFDNQSQLKGDIAGSGTIEINSFEGATDMAFTISGSGKVIAKEDISSLENLILKISGSGDYRGFPLATETVKATITGSGSAKVTPNKSLTATVSGSGDIHYKGKPSTLVTTVNGSGKIKAVN